MAGYVARTGVQKKKAILAKRERELDGAYIRSASDEEIARIIEKVRTAQLGVLKCLHYELAPAKSEDTRNEAALKNLNEKQQWWMTMSHRDIIRHYCPDLTDSHLAHLSDEAPGESESSPETQEG